MTRVAYFDNAATTFVKPQQVHDFMYDFYMANSVNVGRGNHQLMNNSTKIVAETRKLIKGIFNATSEYETVFTPSATEAINVILQGQDWSIGDVIYMSQFEHNAVYRTVKYLERKFGISIELLATNKTTLKLDFEAIKYQFSHKSPKFVIVTHVSNVCGNIADVDGLGKIVKQYKAGYAIDCAQSAGLLETNIINCLADYMVFAGHKTLYGPFGCAGFVCKKACSLHPLLYGGTGIDSASEDMSLELPTRFEAGSQNVMSIAGLYAALKWREEIKIDSIRAKEIENYNRLLDILEKYNYLVIGEGKNSTSIASCSLSELPIDIYANLLFEKGIIVRAGLQCAPQAHRFLGTFPEGTVRFSVSYFTNENDFEMLDEALAEISSSI